MLELWGGHECTVSRTRAGVLDQTRLSGHQDRLDDLDRFAALGVRALRYPLLWERIAPQRPDARDWRWCDQRLQRLQALGVRPIAGLVHHGGGPGYTDLLDPGFAPGLAAHAAAAARRYPWIEDWTPVNEPLTTARFSALYGHWHPHAKDETSFWTALLNQIDAVRLAMAAIRRINPKARLIQTEDLGRTYATTPLGGQAAFDNLRRWMTWDLLTGAVTPDHGLWARLEGLGLGDRLAVIADDPCAPDIMGVNHYLTSDRFLDHRTALYQGEPVGGNGREAYVDVAAVRVTPHADGLEGALRRCHARYGLPIAVTEVHNGCTREEQMRWMLEAWRAAERLSSQGLPIQAVTAWSLLGAHDWDSLLTRADGHYESGVFDLRAPTPRPTALAGLARSLVGGQAPHPVAEEAGWWRRPERFLHATDGQGARLGDRPAPSRRGPPLLIAGASGALGKAFARACRRRGLEHVLTDRGAMDLHEASAITDALDRLRPWAVVNATGFSRVDAAEARPQACYRVNTASAVRLARACAKRGLPLLGFSTGLVFDGAADRAYVEDDVPRPLSVYGRSKADAEGQILALGGGALIIRSAAFFSRDAAADFPARLLAASRARRPFRVAADVLVSPTCTQELADAALDLLIDGERGIWHLANQGEVSWAQFARMLCARLKVDERHLQIGSGASMGWTAARPARSSLSSQRGILLGSLDRAVARYATAVL